MPLPFRNSVLLLFLLAQQLCLPGWSSQSRAALRMVLLESSQTQADARLLALHNHHLALLSSDPSAQLQTMVRNKLGKKLSVPSTDGQSMFVCQVTFGTQTLQLSLDTGSTPTWVTSSDCRDALCAKHGAFAYQLSPTFQASPYEFVMTFGSGSIKGDLGYETVTLAGLAVPRQLVGLANEEAGTSFDTHRYSGILGLAYPAEDMYFANASDSPPFFDSLMRARVLDANAFSFWLASASDPLFFLGSPRGEYYFGDLDFFPVVDKSYWVVELEDILVHNQSLGLCPAGGCRAAVDSGTGYMGAPSADLGTILSALAGDSDPAAKCVRPSLRHPRAVITYVLAGGRRFELGPEDYVQESGEFCKFQFMAVDVTAPHGPLHVLGDVFFRKYFVHFDRDSDRVGIALARREVWAPNDGDLVSNVLLASNSRARRGS
jgi:hypothetical protein